MEGRLDTHQEGSRRRDKETATLDGLALLFETLCAVVVGLLRNSDSRFIQTHKSKFFGDLCEYFRDVDIVTAVSTSVAQAQGLQNS